MNNLKLFCIPHAGGMACAYYCLRDLLDEELEFIPIELAGRGSRFREKTYENFSDAVTDVLQQIEDNLEDDDDYAIFGHSMGAWLTYEVYNRIREKNMPLPVQLFFSGAKPPIGKEITHYDQSDAEFLEMLRKQGGTPEEVLNNHEMITLFLPIIRSDYQMLGAYSANPRTEKIISKITVLYGEQDAIFSKDDMDGWKDLAYQFSSYAFSGDHFYIYNNAQRLADIILNELAMNAM